MRLRTLPTRTLPLVLAALTCSAYASDTANLTTTGQIRPSACSVELSNGATIDFGTIRASSLSNTAATFLPSMPFTMTLTCDASTMVGVVATDGRPGSYNTKAGQALVGNEGLKHAFGMGRVNDKTVGAYRISRTTSQPAIADGNPIAYMFSDTDGASWQFINGGNWAAPEPNRILSWGAQGMTRPSPVTTVTQPFTIVAAIAPKSELPALTASVPLDGLAIFTVRYL